MSDKQKIDELLTRGVGDFIDPDGIFRKSLENNPEKIIIKFGIDPTRPDIHLGHAVVFRKLRQFQDLGCKVVFLIGDYTGKIGDPTGKSKVRPEVEQSEIETNMKSFISQVDNILLTSDKNSFSWIRNSDWFTAITDLVFPGGEKVQMDFVEGLQKQVLQVEANSFVGKALVFEKTRMQVVDLKIKKDIVMITLNSFLWSLKHITHSRLIGRDMFQDRIKNNEELYLHEMMYPVLQGIDSYALGHIYGSCDLEVGGTDQTFNMLMGRDIMKFNKQKPQAVLAFKLLEGTDGKEKMSKSLDNYVGITDQPADMYGKIMSIPDSSIINYFELCTFTPMDEIENIKKKLNENSVNPKDVKMDLAKQIVEIYHGKNKAVEAENNFVNTFQKKEIPEEMTELEIKEGETLMSAVVKGVVVASNSEFRRLVEEGAVTNLETNEKITDANFMPIKGSKFRIGKHRFIKIV